MSLHHPHRLPAVVLIAYWVFSAACASQSGYAPTPTSDPPAPTEIPLSVGPEITFHPHPAPGGEGTCRTRNAEVAQNMITFELVLPSAVPEGFEFDEIVVQSLPTVGPSATPRCTSSPRLWVRYVTPGCELWDMSCGIQIKETTLNETAANGVETEEVINAATVLRIPGSNDVMTYEWRTSDTTIQITGILNEQISDDDLRAFTEAMI